MSESINVLEETILLKTDEEILSIYENFKENGHYKQANQLRTAFILNRAVERMDLQWTEELKHLIHEESIHLRNYNANRFILQGNRPYDIIQRDAMLEFSRINTFLFIILKKQNNFENTDFEMIASKEWRLISDSNLRNLLMGYLASQIAGENTYPYKKQLFFYSTQCVPEFKEILLGIQKGQLIEKYESTLEETYNRFLVGKRFMNIHVTEGVTNVLFFLFIHYLEQGDIFTARSYIVKTLNLLPRGDYLIDILTFVEKIIPKN